MAKNFFSGLFGKKQKKAADDQPTDAAETVEQQPNTDAPAIPAPHQEEAQEAGESINADLSDAIAHESGPDKSASDHIAAIDQDAAENEEEDNTGDDTDNDTDNDTDTDTDTGNAVAGTPPLEETPPLDAPPLDAPPLDAPALDTPTLDTPTLDTPAPADPAPEKKEKKNGWLSRLTAGLSKSSGRLTDGVAAIFNKRKLDDETLEDLSDLLIGADLGVAAATRITDNLAKDKFDKTVTDEEVRTALAEEVAATLEPHEKPLVIEPAKKPHVILMTGVNGAGKTTTIGKLAQKYKDQGLSVMLAAGDTFRAAAIEQLSVWGERTGAPIVARDVGADAAGLAFDALKDAQAADADVLIIDTAGRLQNKSALMEELAKIVRVVKKIDEEAPHDVILVLDATVGQNAVSQAKAFTDIAGVTGIVMTKLDGTARGGVLVSLADQFALPIHYIGVGESVDDLQPFRARNFARALAGVED